MSKNQFTGTVTEPQCNRKCCQFNNDQYCNGKVREPPDRTTYKCYRSALEQHAVKTNYYKLTFKLTKVSTIITYTLAFRQ